MAKTNKISVEEEKSTVNKSFDALKALLSKAAGTFHKSTGTPAPAAATVPLAAAPEETKKERKEREKAEKELAEAQAAVVANQAKVKAFNTVKLPEIKLPTPKPVEQPVVQAPVVKHVSHTTHNSSVTVLPSTVSFSAHVPASSGETNSLAGYGAVANDADVAPTFSSFVQKTTGRNAFDDSNEFVELTNRESQLYHELNGQKSTLVVTLNDIDQLLAQINTAKRELNEVTFSLQQYVKLYQGQVDDVVNRQKELVNDLTNKEKFHL
ncbi:MAG: hypothetical protein LBC33_00450 [Mycoplasmataceae bacterium]|jgi:hypothetical protein|nr:hypothetical protein [Mycoplasmataceae bacterium]